MRRIISKVVRHGTHMIKQFLQLNTVSHINLVSQAFRICHPFSVFLWPKVKGWSFWPNCWAGHMESQFHGSALVKLQRRLWRGVVLVEVFSKQKMVEMQFMFFFVFCLFCCWMKHDETMCILIWHISFPTSFPSQIDKYPWQTLWQQQFFRRENATYNSWVCRYTVISVINQSLYEGRWRKLGADHVGDFYQLPPWFILYIHAIVENK